MSFTDRFPKRAALLKPHGSLGFPAPLMTAKREAEVLAAAKKEYAVREARANREAHADIDRTLHRLNAERTEAIENPTDLAVPLWIAGCVEWTIRPYFKGRVPETVAVIFRVRLQRIQQKILFDQYGLIVPGTRPQDAQLPELDVFKRGLERIANMEMDPARRKRQF